MGSGASQLSSEELQEIESKTYCESLIPRSTEFDAVSKKEIQRLYKRYRKLDRLQIGALSKRDFMVIPELAGNPLGQRVLEVMDTDNDDVVKFEEFISALSMFHPKADRMDKLRYNDGTVTPAELKAILTTFVASGFSDSQLQHIVDRLIQDFDADGDGVLSFEEFSRIVTHMDLENKMTISF